MAFSVISGYWSTKIVFHPNSFSESSHGFFMPRIWFYWYLVFRFRNSRFIFDFHATSTSQPTDFGWASVTAKAYSHCHLFSDVHLRPSPREEGWVFLSTRRAARWNMGGPYRSPSTSEGEDPPTKWSSRMPIHTLFRAAEQAESIGVRQHWI